MIIYLEEIFFENFIIFLLLAMFVSAFLGQREKLLKQIFASIIVSCFETAGIILGLGKFGHLLLLIFNTLLVVLLSQKGSQKFFVSAVLGFVFLVVIDGLRGVVSRYYQISIVMEGVCLLLVFLIFKLIRYFYNIKRLKKFEYKINFYNEQNVFSAIAYLDSGNFLLDDLLQKPIVIVDYNTFLHITGISIENFVQGKYCLKNSHYIDYQTISGGKKMLVFEIDRVEVDGRSVSCLLGLNMGRFENNYSALFGVQVLGDMI